MHVASPSHIPPPPWKLEGEALLAMQLVPRSAARALIPHDLEVVCVWPGRTLAALYLSQYERTPVGEYREWIVAPGLARGGGRIGFWISHIVVDSEASAAAGRSIWALPKTLGAFEWKSDRGAGVQASSDVQASVAVTSQRRWRMSLPFIGAAHSRIEDEVRWFTVRGTSRASLLRANIRLTGDASIDALRFDGSMSICRLTKLRLVIGAPTRDDQPSRSDHRMIPR